MYAYSLYGLRVRSDFPLPELLSAPDDNAQSDVTICEGQVPDTLGDVTISGVLFQLNQREFALQINHVARFLVRDGREIIVERLPGSDDDSVRLFLLGSAVGALLHQRGMMPLHASSIDTPQGAVLFAGASGMGKSTLAAAFYQKRQYPLLADDISVVYADQGQVMVRPAYPQMKLWAQSLYALETDTSTLHRVRPALEKYALPVRDRFVDEPRPVCALYVLRMSNKEEFNVTPITGMDKLRVLKNQTYRMRFLEGMGKLDMHFGISSVFIQQVKMAHVQRPQLGFRLDELIHLIEQDLGL